MQMQCRNHKTRLVTPFKLRKKSLFVTNLHQKSVDATCVENHFQVLNTNNTKYDLVSGNEVVFCPVFLNDTMQHD